MNLQKNTEQVKNRIRRKNFDGSYIVEAGLTLPVFIICVVALALIINVITICENIGFVTSMEIKDLDLKARILEVPISVKGSIENSVYDANPQLNTFEVTNLDYKYYRYGIEDLIGVDTLANFKVANPIGIYGEINFDLNILSRAFSGKTERGKPLDEESFHNGNSKIVVIFPAYGKRYHLPTCTYVVKIFKDNDTKVQMEKEEALRRGYTPCKVCGGGEMPETAMFGN